MLVRFYDKTKDIIRDQDFFGHTICLNFDKAGDTHNTVIGGFVSVGVRTFITFYVLLNVKKLLWYEADNQQYSESFLDLEENGVVDYNTTEFKLFFVINNENYKDVRYSWGEELKKRNEEKNKELADQLAEEQKKKDLEGGDGNSTETDTSEKDDEIKKL